MRANRFSNLPVKELKRILSEDGATNLSKLTKSQLIERLLRREQNPDRNVSLFEVEVIPPETNHEFPSTNFTHIQRSTPPNVTFRVQESFPWFQVVAAVSANLPFIVVGTILVWPTAYSMIDEDYETNLEVSGDDFMWITLCSYFGQCCSPLIACHTVDVVGRKYTLASTFILFMLSWIIIAVARKTWHLYIGRLVGGMGIGIVYTVTPMYVGEIADDNIRGALVSVFQVMFVFGMGYEYLVSMFVSPAILCVASCVFPILFLLSFIWMPESPYYLIMKDREREAVRSLMLLRGASDARDVKDEFQMIQSLTTDQPKYMRKVSALWTDKAARRAILILLAAVFFQVFSGILSVLTFVPVIFRITGRDIAEETTGVIVAAIQLFTSICAVVSMDRVGRKTLFIASCIACCITAIAEGFYFFFYDDATKLNWFPLVVICIYLLAFPLGLGPVPLTLASEIFAVHVKGTALSVTTIFSAGTSLLGILIFDLISRKEGEHLSFWICSIFCAVGAGFMFYFLIETAGKPLAEILEDFRGEADESDT